MTTSSLSPFRWRDFPRDSIFMADPAFYRGASTGKTVNTLQSEAMERFAEKNGRSAGTIHGISERSDQQGAMRAAGDYRRKRA